MGIFPFPRFPYFYGLVKRISGSRPTSATPLLALFSKAPTNLGLSPECHMWGLNKRLSKVPSSSTITEERWIIERYLCTFRIYLKGELSWRDRLLTRSQLEPLLETAHRALL